ncbi:CocE/NonD family hydrolase [Polluticoccus soli]|uniref:CocE/NonD family hydrolase n=1 Tax=Polluticoccus soli TaxID=3034150 RepID=UPI0023E18D9C|nr:CocE/NonD family hydrolase [Flavipsychrobacter sp. JY13-12]
MKYLFHLLLFIIPAQCLADAKSDSVWVRQHYTKREIYIPMRDGIRLYTAVYEPKDRAEKHPILINRTPYSIAPYGEDAFKAFWNNYWMNYLHEGYVIVLQDVRGRMMSEGVFEDVRPYNDHKSDNNRQQIDEASDTYDTIEWLLKNVKDNNGKVGAFGISYPGFYATMAALSQHPALKAASPQAPVTDWFAGDDFHHNGAFMLLDAFGFYSSFGKPRPYPVKTWPKGFDYYSKDNYKFYLETGALKNFAALMGDSIKFWNDLYAHPNYDEWWQVRNTRSHVQHIPKRTATLVVGGTFDAEDCYGAWNLYQAIEHKAKNDNRLIMGPWAHNNWALNSYEYLGNIRFGSNLSKYYQEHFEVPYFNYYLKGKGNIDFIKEANIYFSGVDRWRGFNQWPPKGMNEKALYLQPGGALSFSKPAPDGGNSRYTSDPANPVPYTEDVHFGRVKEYMTDDQRFASRRPDVLVFKTDVLKQDLTLAGPVIADFFASITTTDADFVVKLIDVFPDDFSYPDSIKGNGKNYPMGGYQMLVRGEVMRGRYRNSLEHPEAFTPKEITKVRFTIPDVAHVFKAGHKVMLQVQSTWFPLVDRNPQQFVNIYKADDKDFVKSTIRLYHDAEHPSAIVLPVLD